MTFVNPNHNSNFNYGFNNSTNEVRNAQNEFSAIFFKEIVKQTFDNESMFGGTKAPFSSTVKDVFIEKFAQELAKKSSTFIYSNKDLK